MFSFLSLGLLTDLENGTKNFNWKMWCVHEWEWNKTGGNNWIWEVEIFSSSQLENDDTMQLIMKKLHEQMLKWKPCGKNSSTCTFFCVNDGITNWC